MCAPLPRHKPMLAKSSPKLPQNPAGYALEVKWDGIRALVYIENGALLIASRNGFDISFRYPEIQGLTQVTGKHQLILDGEIVAFDSSGLPSFSLLQQRMNLERPTLILQSMGVTPVTYIIFDLLHKDGQDLTKEPYCLRREELEKLALSGFAWTTPPYQVEHAAEFFAASSKLGLEGIILKRLNSPYLPGKRSDNWLKVKNFHRQEFIIGGWTAGEGSRLGTIGALLLGYYPKLPTDKSESTKLLYAGSCGTGFNGKTLALLKARLEPLAIGSNPFSFDPKKDDAHYVKPVLVAEIAFAEWTPAQTLRHPSFLGLRSDKQASQVVKEI